MNVRPLAFCLRSVLALASIAVIVGCAGVGGGYGEAQESPSTPGAIKARGISTQQAQAAITLDKSTKADVAAALGKAIVVRFDSGYEIWVYRWKGTQKTTRGDTELVVLFDRTGLAKKMRVRPGYEERG